MSKINTHYLYASDRMSHYMAAGIMALIPEDARFEDILGTNAFVSFKTKEELWDKALYYKKNNAKRNEIAKTGYKRIHDIFSVDKVCQYILETTFNIKYSIDYKWPTHGVEKPLC